MIYRLRADSRNFLSFDVSAYDISFTLGDFLLLDKPLWREFWQPMNAAFFDENDMGKLLAMPDITVWLQLSRIESNSVRQVGNTFIEVRRISTGHVRRYSVLFIPLDK
jgi:hypothetical protein